MILPHHDQGQAGGRHQLLNKQPSAGMDGLKEYLLAERQDQFARAMTHKLTAGALGRHLTFADRADGGIDDVIQEPRSASRPGAFTVQSRIFNSK